MQLSISQVNISPMFNKIPSSVIMKSKQWSLANDKLAEINQTALSEFTLLNATSNQRNMKTLGIALQSYLERDIIKKLKQNTWNWIVANKIEYVNFMANNYDKFKDWYIKYYGKDSSPQDEEKEYVLLPDHIEKRTRVKIIISSN